MNNNNNKKKQKKASKNSSSGPMVKAPTAQSKSMRTKNVQIIKSSTNSYRFRKSEYISDITSATTFSAGLHRFELNPGLPATFPWLSEIAKQWEEYRFHSLEFEYVTRAPTSLSGSLIMAPDYDPSDGIPASEADLTAYADAVEDALWKDITCRLNQKSMFPIGDRKYVRTGNEYGAKKLYDVGLLFVDAINSAGSATVGKLWVHYDVELFVPCTVAPPAAAQIISVLYNSAAQSLSTGTETTIIVNGFHVNSLGLENSSGVMTPPKGTYLVSLQCTTASSAATSWVELIYLFEDGLEYTPETYVFDQGTITSSVNNRPKFIQQYVTTDGTHDFEWKIDLTAAGTLSILEHSCRVIWVLV